MYKERKKPLVEEKNSPGQLVKTLDITSVKEKKQPCFRKK